jgi:3-oxoacyl-[acyl-carrier protein] reductase
MPLEPASVRLDDRVAVVTGAAAGIGKATAIALARFGADLAVCDRDAHGLAETVARIQASGRTAISGVLDVRDAAAVVEFFDRLPELHVLVNNAGGGFHADFLDVSEKGRDALLSENLTSVMDAVRAAVPHMPGGGSIVNVTSIEAHRGAPGYAIYAAAKAAVANLTMSLALELGPKLIRVNCVAPDVIPTPGVGNLGNEPRSPLPVQGHPDDVAAAVVFLASDMARFVTGTTIHVDGGNLAAGGWRRTDAGWTT